MQSRILVWLIAVSLTATANASYVPITISNTILSSGRSALIGGSTYPLGAQTLGGVPFNLGTNTNYCWTAGWSMTDAVQIATIPTSISNVARVYFTMNTEAGQPGPNSYINVQFNGS